MDQDTLVERYNYPCFEPEAFGPWLDAFETAPRAGDRVADFGLYDLADRSEVRLAELLRRNKFTVLEFGSFT